VLAAAHTRAGLPTAARVLLAQGDQDREVPLNERPPARSVR
jgi:hypothetical protein